MTLRGIDSLFWIYASEEIFNYFVDKNMCI